jgi:negative regulator of sigma E activity
LVSVFAEPLAGQREMPESGDFSMGGVNVHRRVVGDQVLVVMGEVPTANLRRIGDGIVTAQK